MLSAPAQHSGRRTVEAPPRAECATPDWARAVGTRQSPQLPSRANLESLWENGGRTNSFPSSHSSVDAGLQASEAHQLRFVERPELIGPRRVDSTPARRGGASR